MNFARRASIIKLHREAKVQRVFGNPLMQEITVNLERQSQHGNIINPLRGKQAPISQFYIFGTATR